jgi:hypothetical protein
MEQKAAIKFCVKLKKTATKRFEMLENAYGEECLLRSSVFECHKRYIEAQKVRMQKSRVKILFSAFCMLKVLFFTNFCRKTESKR